MDNSRDTQKLQAGVAGGSQNSTNLKSGIDIDDTRPGDGGFLKPGP